jgi:uncharacterized membrane protein YiaA
MHNAVLMNVANTVCKVMKVMIQRTDHSKVGDESLTCTYAQVKKQAAFVAIALFITMVICDLPFER